MIANYTYSSLQLTLNMENIIKFKVCNLKY